MLDNDMYVFPTLGIGIAKDHSSTGSFALSELALSISGAAVGGQAMHVQLYAAGESMAARLRRQFQQRALATLLKLPIAAVEHVLTTFVYMHSDDSAQAQVQVQQSSDGGVPRIHVQVDEVSRSLSLKRRVLRLMRGNPMAFGFFPLTSISTPFGFSGHACGTLPMREHPQRLESHLNGLIEGTRALYSVDAANFPVLSAQNLTYTAMANARRIGTAWALRASRPASLTAEA
jgi:choline dehydrogenase-like flavoprotein